MATIFPLSASVGQVFDGYEFDGTSWNIIGIDLTANYALDSELTAHEVDTTNVHGIVDTSLLVVKSELSSASALAYASSSAYTDSSISNLVDAAPSALNTLNELAAALNDDANFATTITNSLAGKLDASSASTTYAPISTTVTLGDNQTLTNKTLTSPTINFGVFTSPEENITVAAIASNGTINFDCSTNTTLYYTSNATGNFTLNFRGNSTTTLNSILGNNQSITCLFLNTNGTNAFYPTAFQIDGASITPRWSGGTAPTSGNSNSIDAYSFSIIKTASATYTVIAGAARFA